MQASPAYGNCTSDLRESGAGFPARILYSRTDYTLDTSITH